MSEGETNINAMSEKAMQKSLADLTCIVPMLPAIVYTYTMNHETGESDIPYISDYCEELFGLAAQVIQNDPQIFVNMVHPDDVPAFTESVVESMSKLSLWEMKLRMIANSGQVIKVHCRSSPHRAERINNDGSVSHLTVWHGVLLDISQQNKETEAEWEEKTETEPLKVLPSFGIDKDGIIKDWNDPMSQMTGLGKHEVLHKSYKFILAGETCQDNELSIPDNYPNTANFTYGKNLELRSNHEHEIKHVYATYRKIILPNGTFSGIFCTCQDISDWKLCQQEKEATEELLNAEKNLTEWLSHEIRNPLSIAMEASLALKDYFSRQNREMMVDEEGSSYVDLISQSITYVVDLLTNMLDLNKCIEGKIVLRPKLCMVKEDIIEPVIRMMSLPHYSRFSSKEVPIHFLSEEDIKIFVDKLRLKQVITNLLSNALKFTNNGFIRVSMRKIFRKNKLNGPTLNDSLMITVSDSGPGISAANYDRIFQKWEQFSSTTSGTGIGLCISRLLVNAMGGTLNFNREYHSGIEGQPGAEFVVVLPLNNILAQDHEGNAMHSVPAFNALSAAVIGSKFSFGLKEKLVREKEEIDFKDFFMYGNYRLLIVDDEKINRKIFRKRFSRLFPQGSAQEADSGERALELTKLQYYDIILIDQFMGEMNGDEAIRLMRDNGVDSCIVGISANAKSMLHVSAGAETFFQKPIPKNEVLLQELLQHLPPPSGWKVLILDDDKLNIHFLKKKLHKVASAHFLSMDIAEKHWMITAHTTPAKALEALQTQNYDLIILASHIDEENQKGMEIVEIARKNSLNENAVIVLNSASNKKIREAFEQNNGIRPFDIYWPKPLPSVEQMRQSIVQILMRVKNE